MNSNTTGTLLALLVCCVWPVAVHLLIINAGNIYRTLASRDWRNAEWSRLNPWRKEP
jgi:hypothetical protein